MQAWLPERTTTDEAFTNYKEPDLDKDAAPALYDGRLKGLLQPHLQILYLIISFAVSSNSHSISHGSFVCPFPLPD